MTTANIIRPQVSDNFTILPNQLLGFGRHIKGLKARDSVVLNYLLSKPPQWKIIAKELTVALNMSINTVYAALTVLQRLGIASYSRNKYGHTKWVVSIAATLYSSTIPPHTKKPHKEICEVLENNEKSKIIIKTTTQTYCCVSEADLGNADTPNNYINEPQIADVEVVAESIDVTPNMDAVAVEVVEVEMVAESIDVTPNIDAIAVEAIEIEMVAETIDVTPNMDAIAVEAIEIEMVAETIDVIPNIDAVTVEPTPQLELPTQLTDIQKLTAKKSIAKADLDNTTYEVVILALKTALTLGNVISPIAYLNGLINKAKDGTLDFSNYNKLKADKATLNRSDEIRNLFAKYGDPILLELVTNGVIHIKSLGLIQYDEVNKLGLINSDWAKKYADIQLQKMSKLTPNKLTTASIKKKQHTAMSADEFEAAKQKQIEMAMALLNQGI